MSNSGTPCYIPISNVVSAGPSNPPATILPEAICSVASFVENYRQKLAVHPGIKWGCKDVGLWLNLMLPQRTNPSRVYNQGHFRNKGRLLLRIQ